MSLYRKYALMLLALVLGSCGFTPVYKQTDASDTESFAAVQIVTPHNLYGQLFNTNLSDLLNPTSISVPAKYRLDVVKLEKHETGLTIEQDSTTSRYKVTVVVSYKLTDIASGKVLDEGRIRREGGYDKVASDYATYVSADDTAKRVIKELAADTKLKIISIIKK